jgi:hypothetical protein
VQGQGEKRGKYQNPCSVKHTTKGCLRRLATQLLAQHRSTACAKAGPGRKRIPLRKNEVEPPP